MAKITRLNTPDQVAEILQVSVPTIKRWLLAGELATYSEGSRRPVNILVTPKFAMVNHYKARHGCIISPS